MQDLIGGVFIISERQHGFGDLVHVSATTMIDGATGTVEDLTLRRDPPAHGRWGARRHPERAGPAGHEPLERVARATVDVPLPVDVDVMRARKLLREVGEAAVEDDELGPLLLDPPAVLGVESFELGQVNLRMVARTLPGKQFEVARRLRILVAQAFQREGIGA